MPEDQRKSPQTHTHLESTYQQGYSWFPVLLLVAIFAAGFTLVFLGYH